MRLDNFGIPNAPCPNYKAFSNETVKFFSNSGITGIWTVTLNEAIDVIALRTMKSERDIGEGTLVSSPERGHYT